MIPLRIYPKRYNTLSNRTVKVSFHSLDIDYFLRVILLELHQLFLCVTFYELADGYNTL